MPNRRATADGTPVMFSIAEQIQRDDLVSEIADTIWPDRHKGTLTVRQWRRVYGIVDELVQDLNMAYNAGYTDGRADGWILSDPWSSEDWRLLDRIAAELCRQRGWVWAEQGNDVRVALTDAAVAIVNTALAATPESTTNDA